MKGSSKLVPIGSVRNGVDVSALSTPEPGGGTATSPTRDASTPADSARSTGPAADEKEDVAAPAPTKAPREPLKPKLWSQVAQEHHTSDAPARPSSRRNNPSSSSSSSSSSSPSRTPAVVAQREMALQSMMAHGGGPLHHTGGSSPGSSSRSRASGEAFPVLGTAGPASPAPASTPGAGTLADSAREAWLMSELPRSPGEDAARCGPVARRGLDWSCDSSDDEDARPPVRVQVPAPARGPRSAAQLEEQRRHREEMFLCEEKEQMQHQQHGRAQPRQEQAPRDCRTAPTAPTTAPTAATTAPAPTGSTAALFKPAIFTPIPRHGAARSARVQELPPPQPQQQAPKTVEKKEQRVTPPPLQQQQKPKVEKVVTPVVSAWAKPLNTSPEPKPAPKAAPKPTPSEKPAHKEPTVLGPKVAPWKQHAMQQQQQQKRHEKQQEKQHEKQQTPVVEKKAPEQESHPEVLTHSPRNERKQVSAPAPANESKREEAKPVVHESAESAETAETTQAPKRSRRGRGGRKKGPAASTGETKSTEQPRETAAPQPRKDAVTATVPAPVVVVVSQKSIAPTTPAPAAAATAAPAPRRKLSIQRPCDMHPAPSATQSQQTSSEKDKR